KCMEQGRFLVLLAVILAFITDGGAYFAGVFLGKHRGITQVSPNKSLEGYIGGFVTGIIFAVLYGVVISAITKLPVNYLSLVLCGFIGALVTELGDLSFSLIKRQNGVKDYGNLLPGHGGMLDRFDSMLFCGPAVLFIVTLLPVF
ncbi:MAG: phosphatidate cytidylyltransferase, partial [Oscillospiraceae bacterium]|nr:phosphatidate cytidylyltransferase [Oscillospiraceae bacterium]